MGLEAGTTIDDLVATNPLSTDPRSEGDDHLRLIKAVLKADAFPKRYLPSGTRMLFQQTTAPIGWTKDVTSALNDSALRIVTGAAASGGSLAFSAAFAAGRAVGGTTDGFAASGTTDNGGAGTSGATTLTIAQMPSHTHQEQHNNGTGGIGGVQGQFGSGASALSYNYTVATGGGGSHTHTTPAHSHTFTGDAHSHTLAASSLAMDVKYTDIIIATKD